MTPEEQKEFLRAVAVYVREEVAKAVQQELADFRFMGSWEQGRSYKRHNSVEHGGSTWICVSDTATRPSTDEPLAWQLCAKRGRDGPRTASHR